MQLKAYLHQASCFKRHASSVIDASLVYIGVYDAIHTKRHVSNVQHHAST